MTSSYTSEDSEPLDPCSQWIYDHHNTTALGDNTINSKDIELEWLKICIGPQRWVGMQKFSSKWFLKKRFFFRMESYILWPLTIVYISMGLTGILGNIMVCTVIARWVKLQLSLVYTIEV